MCKIDNVAGRLVEVRLASPLSLEKVHQLALDSKTTVSAIHGKYVGVVDVTHATLFSAPVTEALIHLLSRAAGQVERMAALIGENATFAGQDAAALLPPPPGAARPPLSGRLGGGARSHGHCHR